MATQSSAARTAAHRPSFSLAEVERLVLDSYGIDASVSSLPSDRDQNFRVERSDGKRWVFKIVNALTPESRVHSELRVLEALSRSSGQVSVPQIVATNRGPHLVKVTGGHVAYLVTWLEGKPLGNVRPHTRDLLQQIGVAAAGVSKALASVEDELDLVDSPWALLDAPNIVRSRVNDLGKPEDRDLLFGFLNDFEKIASPIVETLPHQAVHGDLNDYNLLISVGESGPILSGMLDVGDSHRSIRIADPAIAAAYCAMHWDDPIGAIGIFLSGYHRELPLSEEEIRVFLPLVTMRLSASVCISASRAVEEPDNDYLTISQNPAWQTLRRLSRRSERLGYYRLRASLGLEPCPESVSLQRWLGEHRETFSPICDHDLDGNATILDLSVASSEPYVLADEPEATQSIENVMRADHSLVGLGRYNEVRLAYNNEIFATESLDGPVQRTVHLGLDIFLPVGAPVYAPIDGTVFGCGDAAQALSYGPTIVLRHEPPDAPTFYTLFGHLTRSDLTGLEPGRQIRKGDVVGHIGGSHENGGWTPHLHFQVVVDMLDRPVDFPGVSTFQDRQTWTSISPDPGPLAGFYQDDARPQEAHPSDLLHRRQSSVGPSLSLSYREPLTILRGRGVYLYDESGRAYLDCVNNVCHVGHSHPAVAGAVSNQMRVLNTNTRYLHPNIIDYAERLTAKLPESLSVCFFVNSGSEANDLALRLARNHSQRSKILVLDVAYHGHLTPLIQISPYKFDGPGGTGRGSEVLVAPMPDTYRGNHTGPNAADRYAEDLRDVLSSTDELGGVAAFMHESLLSCGGQIEPPPGYLKKAYDYARATGALCIADEVQVGFGRVGTHFWGFESHGVVPDIVTMGKPIGNGHPLAAVVTTPEVAASFMTGMEYFNTYGGNPVSCAAGLAVLDVIDQENLQSNALDVGAYLKNLLEDIKDQSPIIGDVRGRGLFLGLELVGDRGKKIPAARQASYVVNRARQLGVLLSTDGPDHNVIKIKPPIVFSRANADRLADLLSKILREDPAQPGL